ncbi:MAG: HipA domain-containing protein [Acidimicrobiales bacterium]
MTGVRFCSVASYQLSYRCFATGRGLTLPGRGELGNYIVKLPSPQFPDVPANEFVMMSWAARIGVEVPEVMLVDLDALDLPPGLGKFKERSAYAIRRFDRADGDRRIHMEDFNQVLAQWPHQKYEGSSYESLAALVLATTGSTEALKEFVRRLVFIIAIGNEDAHLKNWSLLYLNGRTATLSPAYDLVSTISYEGLARGLGLSLDRNRSFDKISRNSFVRMAKRIDLTPDLLLEVVDATVDVIRGTLDEFAPGLRERESALRDHLARVPLFSAPQSDYVGSRTTPSANDRS